ncbi:MAG: nucleoside hydrolase [Cellulosilyticaceae bacterium]
MNKKKVIFDCDNTCGVPGCDVDDGLALLYLLGKEKQIHLEGITTTYGNSNIETVYENTQKMLKEINHEEIPLLKGCSGPSELNSDAVEYLVQKVQESPNELYILATGSLTNLYGAYCKDQTIFEKIKGIVIMGGITKSLVINGKVMDELNLSCDPRASYTVLKYGRNVSVVTGHNCLPAYFTHEGYKKKLLQEGDLAGNYIYEKTAYWFDIMKQYYDTTGFYNWDVVAAAYLVQPNLFESQMEVLNATIVSLEKGYLIDDNARAHIAVNLPTIKNSKLFEQAIYEAWKHSVSPKV